MNIIHCSNTRGMVYDCKMFFFSLSLRIVITDFMKNAAYGQRNIHAECAIVWMSNQNKPTKFVVDFLKICDSLPCQFFRVIHFSEFVQSSYGFGECIMCMHSLVSLRMHH